MATIEANREARIDGRMHAFSTLVLKTSLRFRWPGKGIDYSFIFESRLCAYDQGQFP